MLLNEEILDGGKYLEEVVLTHEANFTDVIIGSPFTQTCSLAQANAIFLHSGSSRMYGRLCLPFVYSEISPLLE